MDVMARRRSGRVSARPRALGARSRRLGCRDAAWNPLGNTSIDHSATVAM